MSKVLDSAGRRETPATSEKAPAPRKPYEPPRVFDFFEPVTVFGTATLMVPMQGC